MAQSRKDLKVGDSENLLAASRQFNQMVVRQPKPVGDQPPKDLDETDKRLLVSLLM